MNREIIKGRRNAAITLEVVFTIAMAVIILFVILHRVNDSIGTMAKNSNMHNITDPNPEKTDWSKKSSVDYSVSENQVNIQTTAEQALEDRLARAKSQIEYYKNNPPRNEPELQDLAKQLTIAQVCGRWDSGYDEIRDSNDIDINMLFNSTSVNGKSFSFNEEGNSLETAEQKVAEIQNIYGKNFE